MGAVYRITHKASGTTYVGSTNDMKRRWRDHRGSLRRGVHDNLRLQRAWDKHGEDAFEWVALEHGIADEELVTREQYWLNWHRGRGEVYNFGECAAHAMRGRRLSAERRRKLSESKKGEKNPNWGKSLSEEAKRRLSEANKGKKLGVEHRHKIGRAMSGKNNPNWGKPLSEETRRKLGKALSGENHPGWGKSLSKATRQKIGEANAKPYPAFIHRETGEVIPAGVNLSRLCRERGLNKGLMCSVVHGRQNHHHGWMLAGKEDG